MNFGAVHEQDTPRQSTERLTSVDLPELKKREAPEFDDEDLALLEKELAAVEDVLEVEKELLNAMEKEGEIENHLQELASGLKETKKQAELELELEEEREQEVNIQGKRSKKGETSDQVSETHCFSLRSCYEIWEDVPEEDERRKIATKVLTSLNYTSSEKPIKLWSTNKPSNPLGSQKNTETLKNYLRRIRQFESLLGGGGAQALLGVQDERSSPQETFCGLSTPTVPARAIQDSKVAGRVQEARERSMQYTRPFEASPYLLKHKGYPVAAYSSIYARVKFEVCKVNPKMAQYYLPSPSTGYRRLEKITVSARNVDSLQDTLSEKGLKIEEAVLAPLTGKHDRDNHCVVLENGEVQHKVDFYSAYNFLEPFVRTKSSKGKLIIL